MTKINKDKSFEKSMVQRYRDTGIQRYRVKSSFSFLKLFVLILVIFGFIGGVYSGITAKAPTSTSTSNLKVDTNGQKIINIDSKTYTLVAATQTKELLYKSGNTYYDANGRLVNENGVYINLEGKELTSVPSITNNFLAERGKNFQKAPLDYDQLEVKNYLSLGIKPTSDGVMSVINKVEDLNKKISLEGEPKEKTKLENERNSLTSTYLSSLSATDILSLPEKERTAAINAMNDQNCKGMLNSVSCFLGGKLNEEKLYSNVVKDYMKKIDALNKGQTGSNEYKNAFNKVKTFQDDYNKCLKEDSIGGCEQQLKNLNVAKTEQMNAYNKELLSMAIRGLNEENKNKLHTSCSSNEITSSCLSAINDEIAKCTTDCESLKIAKVQLESGYKQTRVQTNTLYDILSVIVNPDPSAIKAAKLLGFEANYNNVPAFLRDSVPSQICMAKIDGYLDKTKESTVNGQGGVTNYGCSEEFSQVYNEQTKQYQKVPNTVCLEVLSDLRAQRTQVTPDGKTAISFSYYIRAPRETELNYIVAVSYKEGSVIKKKEIVPLTNFTGIKNGFDDVELDLNTTNIDSIDENSFTINLLAIFSDKAVYQKLSYPILPVSFGDMYTVPIPRTASGSSDGGSNGAPGAALSTQDMLDMI